MRSIDPTINNHIVINITQPASRDQRITQWDNQSPTEREEQLRKSTISQNSNGKGFYSDISDVKERHQKFIVSVSNTTSHERKIEKQIRLQELGINDADN